MKHALLPILILALLFSGCQSSTPQTNKIAASTSTQSAAQASKLPSTTPPEPIVTLLPTPVPGIPRDRFTRGYVEIAPPPQELIEQAIATGVVKETLTIDDLTFEVHENQNKPGQSIVFGRDPKTQRIILATRQNPSTGGMTWCVAGLRDLADVLGLIVGTHFSSDGYPYKDLPSMNSLVIQEFNGAFIDQTAWAIIEPQEGVFVYNLVDGMVEKSSDAVVQKAQENQFYIRAAPIIDAAGAFQYSYLKDRSDISPEELLKVMDNHIRQVMIHFKGKVSLYDVVNESRPPSETKSDGKKWDMFSAIIGQQQYLEDAYRAARETDPQATLIYNEGRNLTSDQSINSENTKLTKQIVAWLRGENLLDGIGIQMHLSGTELPDKQQVIETFKSYGLPVYITELDVDMSQVSGTPEERNYIQAKAYQEAVEACLESGVCHQIWFWDVSDKYSWLDKERGGNSQADPTMFDDNLTPKPAYFAVFDALQAKITS